MVASLALLACRPPSPPVVTPDPVVVTLIGINDVYRIEGLPEAGAGGLARVRALRRQLEDAGEHVLLLHAGDFLFPSFASRSYKGEQMVDVLNQLDADGQAFDPGLLVTIGNHELEDRDPAVLQARLDESQFTWLAANIRFAVVDGEPAVASEHLLPRAVLGVGPVRVGVFGLGTDVLQPDYVAGFDPWLDTARAEVTALREQADVVVALTHLEAPQDLAVLDQARPDVIIGGHDHSHMALPAEAPRIFKADADALSAQVVRITVSPSGEVLAVDHELVPLVSGEGPDPDPQVQAVVDGWQARHEADFCAAAGSAPGCLSTRLGVTQTSLDGEELLIRRQETSLGDWVADAMRARLGADVALVNAGALRLNRNLPPGAVLTRRHVEEIDAFESQVVVVELKGAQLSAAATHSVTDWPGGGRFLQVSGVRWDYDTTSQTASMVQVQGPDGWRDVDPSEALRVAMPTFLAGGGDGYDSLAQGVPTEQAAGLKALLTEALAASGTIAPVVEGRTCEVDEACPRS